MSRSFQLRLMGQMSKSEVKGLRDINSYVWLDCGKLGEVGEVILEREIGVRL